jgi:hypothetical protein
MKKNLVYLLLALMPMFILSCKKDKAEEPRVTTERWILQKAMLQEYDLAGGLTDSLTDSSFTANDYLSLQSDGQFEWVTGGQKINGAYKIENSFLLLSNRTGSLQASIIQKSLSSFTFFWEEADTQGKIRYTFYYKL